MNYGLIGEKLGHSYSKEIHASLADYDYRLLEVAKENLDTFLKEKDFKAINVTIPYKEAVIPYLYHIDESAKSIGSVNTIVNRDGNLYGYNTDFYGLYALIEKIGVSLSDKKVAILGTGGTSKTAYAVACTMGAKEVIKVSRSQRDGAVTYNELYEKHQDTEYIINTTPLGMYPDIFNCPVDISKFESLSGVADAVYNPLRTQLVLKARERGIPSEGGLYMLVAQAARASEIFIDTKYPKGKILEIYNKILSRKENIVLIGMPASGKTTVGKLLSKRLCRDFFDTDEILEKNADAEISHIFKAYGEEYFRNLETEAIKQVSVKNSAVIATGGGAILRKENLDALKSGGRLFFIDRPVEKLIPTQSRPLSSDREAIIKRYEERYDIYLSVCDVHIDADASAEEVAEKIING